MALYEATEDVEFYDGTHVVAGMLYRTEEPDHAALVAKYPELFVAVRQQFKNENEEE